MNVTVKSSSLVDVPVDLGMNPSKRAVVSDPMLAGLVTVFVLAFFVPGKIAFNAGPLQLTPMRAIALVLMPLMLSRGRIRWGLPDAAMAVVFLVGFITFAKTGGPVRAAEAIGRQTLDSGLPYLVGRWLTQDRHRFEHVVRRLIDVLCVFSVVAVLEALFRVNVHREVWGLIGDAGRGIHPEMRMGVTRVKAWTDHPIMFGLVYASVLPLLLYARAERSGCFGRSVNLKIGLCLLGVFWSVSSGAFAAALIVIALHVWERRGPGRSADRWAMAWVGAPTVWYGLDFLSGRPLMRILMMKLHLSSPMAWHYRWQLYRRVMDAMPGHWMLGHGLSTPENFVGGYAQSVDNHYLMVLLNRGVVGVTVWVLFMVAACLGAAKWVWFGQDTATTRLARAVCFSIVMFAIAQFSVAVFSTAGVLLWMWMGAAVGLGQACRDEARAVRMVATEQEGAPA